MTELILLNLDRKSNEVTTTAHYHYTAWPDFGVPDDSKALIQMVLDLRKLSSRTMTVVHCSAGVGRTGTFLSLIRLLDQIDAGKTHIDIFNTVLTLRRDRTFMVIMKKLTFLNLKHIFHIIFNYFLGPETGTISFSLQMCCQLPE